MIGISINMDRINPNDSLDLGTAEPNSVADQILRNAYDNKDDNLTDTALPENRMILRAYQILKRELLTFAPTNLRIWDLFVDRHEIDKRIEYFFEVEDPNASIIVFDRANNDSIIKYNRSQKYSGDYVYSKVSLYYTDVDHVRPDLIRSLDPGIPDNSDLILLGELPASYKGNGMVMSMLDKAGMLENYHWDPQEMARLRRKEGVSCHKYNCPICRDLEYTIDKARELDLGYLNGSVTVWLGETIHAPKVKEYDELKFLKGMLEQIAINSQIMAVMSDAAIAATADIKTLERMHADYERLLKVIK